MVVTITAAGTFNGRIGLFGNTNQQTADLSMWGVQHEVNAFLSSVPSAYIPTTSAAASMTDFAVNGTGLVTFAAAPIAGAALTWSGSFYWRCRFVLDQLDFAKFAYRLWNLRTCKFVTVKP